MFDPEVKEPQETEIFRTPVRQTFETQPRGEGEAPYPKERIYADAHYEPAGESTVPPRYYTPPEKTSRTVKVKKAKQKRGIGVFPAICMCLVCALLGGMLAGGLLSSQYNARLAALEGDVSENARAIEAAKSSSQTASPVPMLNASGSLDAAQIYAQSLEQVVGITTEVVYRNYFGQTVSSPVSGSGFIISADGYILTNFHVIEYAYESKKSATVMTYDGTEYKAEIVGADEGNDIAVLKIDAEGLNPVTFADSDSIAVGDTVYAVGNPLGELDFTMTTGMVSALDRTITADENYVPINMFQIDAAVNPGNSGGPVYNAAGQVIGVVTAKSSATGVEGLGFAVPANDAVNIANELMENGFVISRVQLGITTRTLSYSAARYYGQAVGVYVVAVNEGSCAEKAGLKPGDIIAGVAGKDTPTYEALKTVLRGYAPGDEVELTIYRNDSEHTLTVTLDAADETSPNNQRNN